MKAFYSKFKLALNRYWPWAQQPTVDFEWLDIALARGRRIATLETQLARALAALKPFAHASMRSGHQGAVQSGAGRVMISVSASALAEAAQLAGGLEEPSGYIELKHLSADETLEFVSKLRALKPASAQMVSGGFYDHPLHKVLQPIDFSAELKKRAGDAA